jgi:SAM-dependent methyltransferase
MTEVTTGVRSILSHPLIYESFSWLIGGERARTRLVEQHIRPEPGLRVLDIGCGPGEMLEYLPGIGYCGIDISERYIERARRRFADRAAEFRVGDGARIPPDLRGFDLALAIGVLHHLDDDRVRAMLSGVATALSPAGRFIAFDGVYIPGQSRVARAIIARDRGQHVRTEQEYVALARSSFGSVRPVIRHDLLRIPYTHLVLECAGPAV